MAKEKVSDSKLADQRAMAIWNSEFNRTGKWERPNMQSIDGDMFRDIRDKERQRIRRERELTGRPKPARKKHAKSKDGWCSIM
jgi:hypothetical protein